MRQRLEMLHRIQGGSSSGPLSPPSWIIGTWEHNSEYNGRVYFYYRWIFTRNNARLEYGQPNGSGFFN